MTVAFYILCALIAVGAVLYIMHRHDLKKNPPDTNPPVTGEESDEVCCGMHMTCEKDSLLTSVSDHIEYYDDEELDRFRGRTPDDYNPDEIEEFRNVLLTLLPDDIAGWARSIQLRQIELPSPVRDELLMIVAEARALKTL